MTVKVGMGNVSRERRVMGLQQVIQLQQGLAQAGAMGSLINPENMWMAHKELMDAMGFEPELFFMDPKTAPPPQPPQPDPQLEVAAMQAQAMMLDAQSKMARAQVDAQKAQAEQQMAQAQIALKARESELKNQISQLEVQLKGMRDKSDSDNKILSMEVEMKRRATENNLKLLQIQLAEMSKQKDRELDKYKADQDASIELAKMTMQEANDILPGGMLVEDDALKQMFAFGDEQPVMTEEILTITPALAEEEDMGKEMEDEKEDDKEEETKGPAPAEIAMASMVEALVDLQRQLNDLQGREVERVVNRDKNGLIVSITEKRRA